MDVFATNLRTRAKELGISNAEVARRAGLSERRYGNYVSGRREPDLATLIRISEVLGVTPNELLGVSDRKSTKKKRARLFDRLNTTAAAIDDGDLEKLAAIADTFARGGSGRGD